MQTTILFGWAVQACKIFFELWILSTLYKFEIRNFALLNWRYVVTMECLKMKNGKIFSDVKLQNYVSNSGLYSSRFRKYVFLNSLLFVHLLFRFHFFSFVFKFSSFFLLRYWFPPLLFHLSLCLYIIITITMVVVVVMMMMMIMMMIFTLLWCFTILP